MKGSSNYLTWSQMNNDPERKDGAPHGVKPVPKSNITIELKDANHLKFALKNSRVVVVKAEADWCEPCKVLAPKYEELAAKCSSMKDHFVFLTDDIDRETSYHAAKVTAVPTFFVYTDGDVNPKKTFTGDFDQLAELINRILFRIQQDVAATAGSMTNASVWPALQPTVTSTDSSTVFQQQMAAPSTGGGGGASGGGASGGGR